MHKFSFKDIQRYNNKNNDNINTIKLMDIHKGKFELGNENKASIGYGLFTYRNKTIDILCILAIGLVSIYAGSVEINRPNKNETDM